MRSLLRRRSRSLLTVLGLALAFSLPVGVNMALDSSVEAVFQGLTRSIPDDIRLDLLSPAQPGAVLSRISVLNSSSIYYTLRFRCIVGVRRSTETSHYRRAELVAFGEGDWIMEAVEVEAGCVPSSNESCMVSHALALEEDVGVGDLLRVWSDLIGGDVGLRVVGVFSVPGFSEVKALYMGLEAWQEVLNASVVNEVGIRIGFSGNVDIYKAEVDRVVSSLREIFEEGEEAFFATDRIYMLERYQWELEAHRSTLTLASSLSIVAGVIGVTSFLLLCYHEQIRELAILKAIGMKGRLLVSYFLVKTLVLSLAGAALSVPLALLVSRLMLLLAAGSPLPFSPPSTVASLLLVRVSPSSLLIALVVPLASSFIPAVYPSMLVARLPPLINLRPYARSQTGMADGGETRSRGVGGKGVLHLIVGTAAVAFSFCLLLLAGVDKNASPLYYSLSPVLASFGLLLLSYFLVKGLSRLVLLFRPVMRGLDKVISGNIRLNSRRVWLISCSFAIGVNMTLSLSAFMVAFQNKAIDDAYVANGADIVFSGIHPPATITDILEVEGVEEATSLLFFDTAQTYVEGRRDIEGCDQILSWFIDPTNYSAVINFQRLGPHGPYWQNLIRVMKEAENPAIISEAIGKALGVCEEDTLRVVISDGENTLFNRSCLVIAIVDHFPGLPSTGNPFVILSAKSLNPSSSPWVMGDRILVRTMEGQDPEQVASRILDKLSGLGLVFDVSVTASMVASYVERASASLLLYNYLAGFVIVISCLTLTVVYLASTLERRFEFGVIRSLGAGGVSLMVMCETLTIGLIGLFTGWLLTIVQLLIVTAESMATGVYLQLVVPWQAALATFAAATLLPILSGWLASRQIARETPAENLRERW